ncbi:RalA-binding protein 1 [Acipenser ruthenus]|uniref:RalA-binding protein 1 n=1 Tax=Acipenser ruthenus TaxID=7906 RepID=A0A444UHQ0_ACIRT|nr:RalA-binding protein 1 [Acipenser ruthenus]
MTECFLPPTSSPSEHRRVEHPGGMARTPSSEEISPIKFPGLYRTGEPSPPHDGLHEPADVASDEEKDHGKKKGKFKKKEKRTEGYAAFQEDSSGDEAESPSKMKRSKGIHVFKKPSFSKKKEKDFKVKEKPKEEKHKEEKHKEEKHKEEKHKEKKSKDLTPADVVKQWKEKKKKKQPSAEPEVVPQEAPCLRPVFGIPLAEAVERTIMYDGVRLPAIFRECIDYIENCGMKCEGIYRVSGMKSKVDELKAAYDREESPCLDDYDPHAVASLLKQYLRELPENLLGRDLTVHFEEACSCPSDAEKVQEFQRCLADMPPCNHLMLAWLLVHMDHIIAKEADTKMNIQNISIVLSPTIQISNRVLYVFFTHIKELFGDVKLKPAVKPLRWSNMATMPALPKTQESVKEEIRRQECETKIAQEIASLSKEDVSKEEMNENEEEVLNILLSQENEILTEQEELVSMEQFLRRQIASENEEIERLRAEIAEIQSRQQQHGRSETEEYSSDSESESEDEEELQLILEDLQKQNQELEIKNTHLNQAIHEEREAIIELRVQLRLLQTEKVKQEQQQGQENGGEELGKRTASITSVQLQKDPMGTETKAGKDPLKPSPSKDRRETPI